MTRNKGTYQFSHEHLKRIAANQQAGYHVTGMGASFERFDLRVGGDMTVAGVWDGD